MPRDHRFVDERDWARAADLLADYGRLASGPEGGRVPPEVRDAINTAHDEDRARELVLALVQVVDGTWPGVLGRADVQQTLALTSIAGREQLGPPLDYGASAGQS